MALLRIKLLLIFFLIESTLFIPTIFALPSYNLGISSEKNIVNEDEPFQLSLIISGGGDIESLKVWVYGGNQVLFSPNKTEGDWKTLFGQEVEPMDKSSFVTLEKQLLEKEKSGQSFIHFYAKSNIVGDHSIPLILSYRSSGGEWYSKETQFTFHVMGWWEKYQGIIIILTVLLAFLTLLSTEKQKEWFMEAVKNKFKSSYLHLSQPFLSPLQSPG